MRVQIEELQSTPRGQAERVRTLESLIARKITASMASSGVKTGLKPWARRCRVSGVSGCNGPSLRGCAWALFLTRHFARFFQGVAVFGCRTLSRYTGTRTGFAPDGRRDEEGNRVGRTDGPSNVHLSRHGLSCRMLWCGNINSTSTLGLFALLSRHFQQLQALWPVRTGARPCDKCHRLTCVRATHRPRPWASLAKRFCDDVRRLRWSPPGQCGPGPTGAGSRR
jgi:hypothetical protein